MNLTLPEQAQRLCDGLVLEGLRPSVNLVADRWQIGKVPSDRVIRREVERWYADIYSRITAQPEGSHLPDWLVLKLFAFYKEIIYEVGPFINKDCTPDAIEDVFKRYWFYHYPPDSVDDITQKERVTSTFRKAYEICTKIAKEGGRPTSSGASKRLGRGSMTVINQAVHVWWGDLAQLLFKVHLTEYPLPVGLYRIGMEMVDQFQPEADKLSAKRYQDEIEGLSQKLSIAKTKIEDMERRLREQEDYSIEKEQSIQSLERQLVAERGHLKTREKELQGQINSLQERLSDKLKDLQDIKERFTRFEEYAKGNEKRMSEEIDRLRQIGK